MILKGLAFWESRVRQYAKIIDEVIEMRYLSAVFNFLKVCYNFDIGHEDIKKQAQEAWMWLTPEQQEEKKRLLEQL